MNRTLLPCLGIGLLLLVFCYRIWDVCPTHTDDAIWRLAGIQGNWSVVTSWAHSQGRVFAFVSGALIYVGTNLQGSIFGPILHVGFFALFFISFHAILGRYFGRRLALMAAVVNLALATIRWDGSIVTTYPLFSWVLSFLFVASVYLGSQYAENDRKVYLCLSFVLFYISLNIHEGVSLLFSMLAISAVIGNRLSNLPSSSHWRSCLFNRSFTLQLIGTLLVIMLYFGGYLAWRRMNPSGYAGNQLGSLNPMRFTPVLCSLSASGTLLTEFISPFVVNYADSIGHDGYGVIYRPLKYLVTEGSNLVAILCGLFVAASIYSLFGFYEIDENDSRDKRASSTPFWICILVGAIIALVPVLPVSLVGKYQDNFYQLKVRSYAFTPLCHFGWSLIIAACLSFSNRIGRTPLRRAVQWSMTVLFGLLSYCVTLRNDSVVADIRLETCRWDVAHRIASIVPSLNRPINAVHAPRLQNGSWFTVVPADYWTSYMQERYHMPLRFENNSISRQAIESGIVFVDYCMTRDNIQPIVFAAALETDLSTGIVVAREIGIASGRLDPSEKAQYILSIRDIDQGIVSHRIAVLPISEKDKSVRILRNVRALPASIRISKTSEVRELNFESGNVVPIGSAVRLGLEMGPVSGPSCKDWLRLGDWNVPERSGSWTGIKAAQIRVPLAKNAVNKFSVKMVASTLTGLGFYDKPQKVTVRIGNRIASEHEFVRGDGWRSFQFEMKDSDWLEDSQLILTVEIDAISTPAELGLSPDTRKLGVVVQSLLIEKKSE